MSRDVPHLDRLPQRRPALTLDHELVDFHRSEPHAGNQKHFHDLGALDQQLVVAVGAHFSVGRRHHLGPSLGVIPVAVRQPKLPEGALLLRQDRLDLLPNAARRVDEHRFA